MRPWLLLGFLPAAFGTATPGTTSSPRSDGAKWIVSGLYPDTPHWNDTDGNRIEAHAAGMLQSPTDKRWYWYGESKKDNNLSDHGVNCYSSYATLNLLPLSRMNEWVLCIVCAVLYSAMRT